MSSDPNASSPEREARQELLDEELLALPAHPVGTLAIVLVFGALFALGWLALYFGLFLPRGATGL